MIGLSVSLESVISTPCVHDGKRASGSPIRRAASSSVISGDLGLTLLYRLRTRSEGFVPIACFRRKPYWARQAPSRSQSTGPTRFRPGPVPSVRMREAPLRYAYFAGFHVGIAQHIATAPDCFDIVLATAGQRQLLAQLADEHVDDLQFRLVHSTVKMVEEHFLGQRRALAERKQLQHRIFLAGQVHAI